jgi:hypothetical protein
MRRSEGICIREHQKIALIGGKLHRITQALPHQKKPATPCEAAGETAPWGSQGVWVWSVWRGISHKKPPDGREYGQLYGQAVGQAGEPAYGHACGKGQAG